MVYILNILEIDILMDRSYFVEAFNKIQHHEKL